jgi:hypothetical protein
MPGDPNECRESAACCLELAKSADEPLLRKAYSDLATRWIDLAIELEKVSALTRALAIVGRNLEQPPGPPNLSH